MRRLRGLLSIAALFALIAPTPAVSQSPVAVSAELRFRSKYLFAGIPFAQKEVQQAQVSVGFGSVTVYGFTVYDLDQGKITEGDIYADYYRQLTPLVGFFVGGALYNFDYGEPLGWEGTQEVYAGIVLGVMLNPTLLVAHDFDLGDGTHVLASISHGVPLGSDGVTLDLAANVDYNAEYYTTSSGLSYVDLGAGLSIPAGPVMVTPRLIVQRRLDDAFEGFVIDEELFGLDVSFSF